MPAMLGGIGWVPSTLSTTSFRGHGARTPSAISVAAMHAISAMRPR
jgi:hypothetical protein